MADNLELAIRIRADLTSALRGLDQMERGVNDIGRAMKRGSVGAQAWQRAIGPFVADDLIARGVTAIACNMRQMAAEAVRAGIAADSLRAAMRARRVSRARGDEPNRCFAFDSEILCCVPRTRGDEPLLQRP